MGIERSTNQISGLCWPWKERAHKERERERCKGGIFCRDKVRMMWFLGGFYMVVVFLASKVEY